MKVKLNADNLKKEIKKIRDLASTAETHRSTIDTECTNEHDPVRPVDFLAQSQTKIRNVRWTADEIEKCMNTIISLNENGVGKMEGENYTVDIPDSAKVTDYESLSKWATKEQAATDARDLKDCADSSKRNKRRRTYAQIIASIQRNKQDSLYADAFIDAVGPENLTMLPTDLQGDGRPGSGSSVDGDGAESLAGLFGELLSTASYMWDDEKCKNVANKIIGSVNVRNRYGNIPVLNAIMGGHDADGDGINDLTFNSAFLLRMGEAAEKIDYAAVRSYYTSGGPLPPNAKAAGFNEYSADPLAGILDAMGNNPDAALNFLAPAKQGEPGVADTSRLQRLTERWKDFNPNFKQDWDRDGFDGLAAAVAAASTKRSSVTPAERARADSLADDAIHYIATNVDSDLYNDSAKARIGMLIANCAGEVTASWSTGGGNGPLKATDGTEFKATPEELNKLVYRVVDDPSAAVTISAGLANYARNESQRGLKVNEGSSPETRLEAIQSAYENGSKAMWHLEGLAEVKADELTKQKSADADDAKKSADGVLNSFEAVIAGGIGTIAGPAGVAASTAFSMTTPLMNPVIVDAATGDAGSVKGVATRTPSPDSGTNALWAASVQDAANAGLLQQSDFDVPVKVTDSQGNQVEVAAHDHYDWIVRRPDGGYTIDLSKGGDKSVGELLTWANTARDPKADRVTGDGPQPQPDETLNTLQPDGELGDGKAGGETAGRSIARNGG